MNPPAWKSYAAAVGPLQRPGVPSSGRRQMPTFTRSRRPSRTDVQAFRSAPICHRRPPAGKPYPVYLVVDNPGDAAFTHQTPEPYTITYRWKGTESATQDPPLRSATGLRSSSVLRIDEGIGPRKASALSSRRAKLHPGIPACALPSQKSTLEVEVDTLGQHTSTTTVVPCIAKRSPASFDRQRQLLSLTHR